MMNEEKVAIAFAAALSEVDYVRNRLIEQAALLQYDEIRNLGNRLLAAHSNLTTVALELRKGFNE